MTKRDYSAFHRNQTINGTAITTFRTTPVLGITTDEGARTEIERRTLSRMLGIYEYSETKHAIVVECIRQGMPQDYACKAASWDFSKFSGMLADAKKHPILLPFRQDIEKAEAYAILQSLQAIRQSGDWKAHKWWLEVRHHAHFGRKTAIKVEHSGQVNMNDVSGMMRDLLAQNAGIIDIEEIPTNGDNIADSSDTLVGNPLLPHDDI